MHDNGSKDLRGYFQFLQAQNVLGRHKGNMVRRTHWGHRKDCTLLVFHNAANRCFNSLVLNPKQSQHWGKHYGSLRSLGDEQEQSLQPALKTWKKWV